MLRKSLELAIGGELLGIGLLAVGLLTYLNSTPMLGKLWYFNCLWNTKKISIAILKNVVILQVKFLIDYERW